MTLKKKRERVSNSAFIFIFLFFCARFSFAQSDDSVFTWQKNHFQDTLTPYFAVIDNTGALWCSDSLRGKVVVLNFWSIYCPPCIHELPELNKLPADFSPDSVVFISVLFEHGDKADSLVSKNKFSYHLVIGGLPIMGDFWNNCFPTHIIIDRKGIIRYNACGTINEKFMRDEIMKALRMH